MRKFPVMGQCGYQRPLNFEVALEFKKVQHVWQIWCHIALLNRFTPKFSGFPLKFTWCQHTMKINWYKINFMADRSTFACCNLKYWRTLSRVSVNLWYVMFFLRSGANNIYITKEHEVIPWKKFNSNMAISIEYNLEY